MKLATHFINESTNKYTKIVTITKKMYHTSVPTFRDKILKEGIKVMPKSAGWLSDTNIDKPVIFAIMSDNIKDAWDSTYDDDIYEIDTSKINNEWFRDPNFINYKDSKHCITFTNIPVNAIKLVYKGTGE
jgi:hypothetical protein